MPEIKVILDYTPLGSTTGKLETQSIWSFLWDVLKGVFAAIAGSLTQALTSAAKELASMLTLNNLVGTGVNYLKEQAPLADKGGHRPWTSGMDC
jgi:hypothetical protein